MIFRLIIQFVMDRWGTGPDTPWALDGLFMIAYLRSLQPMDTPLIHHPLAFDLELELTAR